MKKILLLSTLFFLFIVESIAQITVTRTDFPSRGDVFFILEDDNMSGLSTGGTGMQTWNYNSINVTGLDTILFVEPSQTPPYQTPFDTLFPNSNLALSGAIGGVYLKINNDSLMLDGIAADLLGQGFVTPVNITPDLKFISFPANYQDGFTSVGVVDTTIDTLILGGIIDKIRAVRTQTNTVSFDAYGTLNLPVGSYQTLRQYTKEVTVTEVYLRNVITGFPTNPDQTLTDTVYRYQWIAKNQGYYVMEAEADAAGNLISGFIKAGSQVFGFPSQIVETSCYGDCDGSATITGAGGTGSYSYQWDANAGGSTSNVVTGLCEGSYLFTITDNINSSSYTDTVVITEPDSISITASVVLESPLENDGEIDLEVSGGTPPYNYTWTGTTQTTQDVNSLAGGNYTVTVSDANMCSKDTTIVLGTRVGLGENAKSEIKIYPNPSSDFVKIDGLSEGSEIYVYNALGELVFKSTKQQLDVINLEDGLYLLEVVLEGERLLNERMIVRH